MARALALVSILLLVAGSGLAGCISKDDASGAVKPASTNNSTNSSAVLPDGRGVSSGNLETNKTEQGVGGVQHTHDYWKGAETHVVFQDTVGLNVFPVYPEGQGTQPEGVAYIKLPGPTPETPGELIFEGAVEVDVLIKKPQALDFTGQGGVDDPAAPTLKLKYRTAADDSFRDAPAVTFDAPVRIPVTPKETDMPHSVSSLWAFIVYSDKPSFDSFNITITEKRGASVVDWPGHPDFYAEKSERVVLDKDYKVHRSGIDEGLLYGAGSSWQSPDKLISYGTGWVDVFVNITGAQASNGLPPTGFFLEYHNATILDAEDEFSERVADKDKGDAFTHKDYHFVVKVAPDAMDGPYQPSSRWGFRPVATFAETPVASLCPGCFPYDISYHMTIIAHKAEGATTGMKM